MRTGTGRRGVGRQITETSLHMPFHHAPARLLETEDFRGVDRLTRGGRVGPGAVRQRPARRPVNVEVGEEAPAELVGLDLLKLLYMAAPAESCISWRPVGGGSRLSFLSMSALWKHR